MPFLRVIGLLIQTKEREQMCQNWCANMHFLTC